MAIKNIRLKDENGNYIHPETKSDLVITDGQTNKFVTEAEKTTWNGKASSSVATQSANGLMSSSDKTKLDGLNASSYLNTGNTEQTKSGKLILSNNESVVSGAGFSKTTNLKDSGYNVWFRTDSSNPLIGFKVGSSVYYFQATSNKLYLGPTSNQALWMDASGNGGMPLDWTVGGKLIHGSYNFTFPSATGTLALTSNIPNKTSDLTNDSGFITDSYHDSTKQDTLTAGQNITIVNNVISATGGGGGTQLYLHSITNGYINSSFVISTRSTAYTSWSQVQNGMAASYYGGSEVVLLFSYSSAQSGGRKPCVDMSASMAIVISGGALTGLSLEALNSDTVTEL